MELQLLALLNLDIVT